ncbi:phasin family protein [Luteimonas marina]|nr:phasin family protein [Luteimonas marina]
MGNASDLALALWKANLDLQLRIGQLVQDSGRDWLELGTRAAGGGAAELDAGLRKLMRGGDWQALAALPVEAFWRQAEQRVGDGQALNQIALQAQDSFASGVLEALQDWQQALAEAWNGVDLDLGLDAAPGLAEAWRSLLSNWDAGIAALAPVAPAAPVVRAPRKPAAPAKKATVAKKAVAKKKPAVKKSAPASRKPAAKKPAKKGSRRRGG